MGEVDPRLKLHLAAVQDEVALEAELGNLRDEEVLAEAAVVDSILEHYYILEVVDVDMVAADTAVGNILGAEEAADIAAVVAADMDILDLKGHHDHRLMKARPYYQNHYESS